MKSVIGAGLFILLILAIILEIVFEKDKALKKYYLKLCLGKTVEVIGAVSFVFYFFGS